MGIYNLKKCDEANSLFTIEEAIMSQLFEVKNVSKTYKKGKVKANKNINFSIYEGEILGLLGPNGAGKSTLVKQLVSHLKPSEGEVLYKGTNVVEQAKRVSQEVAYYSQEPASLTSLKVKEALYFCGRLRGLKKTTAKQETESLIEKLGLKEVENKIMKRISGGQKRLVGIGTTLIGFAPVLIFDEPTNELDPKKRKLVWDLIREKNRQGATIILVTHNILEAEQVVDRVAVINHGRLLAVDEVSVLKGQVDQRLRVDVTTTSSDTFTIKEKLKKLGTLMPVTEQRFRVMVGKAELLEVIRILQEGSIQGIQSYAIAPPSLEDVYFHIDDDEKELEEEEKVYATS